MDGLMERQLQRSWIDMISYLRYQHPKVFHRSPHSEMHGITWRSTRNAVVHITEMDDSNHQISRILPASHLMEMAMVW